MSEISYLVYTSTANKPFSDDDLFTLLKKSRASNDKVNVTGALMYKNGIFVQMVEGSETDIETLREKIYRDSRHGGVLTLIRGTAETRVFGEWTMHFIVGDKQDARARDANYRCLRGKGDIEDIVIERESYQLSPDTDELHPGLRLLLTFRQIM